MDYAKTKTGSSSRLLKVVRMLLITMMSLVLFVLALAVAGAAYQAIGNWNDARRFPQVGRLVQAGPIKLNIDCSGEGGAGKPTVILESAGAVPARGWAKVQPEVAKFTRVCSYDRAGYGWSEPGPKPRTMEQEAKELKMLLQAAGEVGPYVMVGHSQGGFNCQAFANLYPDDVVGVVLVDASHPDTIQRTAEVLSKSEGDLLLADVEHFQSWWFKTSQVWLARLGITRLLVPAPDELSREINYLMMRTKGIEAFADELAVDETSKAQIRAAGNLGDIPLIVLTAGKSSDGIYSSETDRAAERRVWVEGIQAEMAKLSSKGKQIIVSDSDHMIPTERPEAVVSAIREVWEQAKTKFSN
jgi:pimeloyl-ACP methyl ester carboxylesterase